MTSGDEKWLGMRRSLWVITDDDLVGCDMAGKASRALEGGATHLVVRGPNCLSTQLIALTRIMADRQEVRERTLIWERADVAIASSAMGIWTPGESFSPNVLRLDLGWRGVIAQGVSTIEHIHVAHRADADVLVVGPIYETETHPGEQPLGIEILREAGQWFQGPVIAVGGITLERIPEVMATGADGVAVMRALSRADDPAAAASEIKQAVMKHYINRSEVPK